MEVSLAGRVCLITGASKGLGLAMAKRFRGAGGSVAIVARRQSELDSAKKEIEAVPASHPGRVMAVSADVSMADQIEKLVKAVQAELGEIDVLVNNAGASSAHPSETVTDEMWSVDLNLKLMAQVRFCRLLMPGMKKRGWGRIINVLNTGAKAPAANSAPTSVSRAAQMAFGKVLANEGAPFGVLVNSLMTGVFLTDQIERRAITASKDKGTSLDAARDQLVAASGKRVPMGRIGDADEFARTALFLASDAASYLTGTAINMDGGLSSAL